MRPDGSAAQCGRSPLPSGRDLPDCVLITCRNPHGGDTYIARAIRSVRAQASSTCGRRAVVEACAAKIYGRDGFKVHQYTAETWLASPNASLDRPAASAGTVGGMVRPSEVPA